MKRFKDGLVVITCLVVLAYIGSTWIFPPIQSRWSEYTEDRAWKAWNEAKQSWGRYRGTPLRLDSMSGDPEKSVSVKLSLTDHKLKEFGLKDLELRNVTLYRGGPIHRGETVYLSVPETHKQYSWRPLDYLRLYSEQDWKSALASWKKDLEPYSDRGNHVMAEWIAQRIASGELPPPPPHP